MAHINKGTSMAENAVAPLCAVRNERPIEHNARLFHPVLIAQGFVDDVFDVFHLTEILELIFERQIVVFAGL